MKNADPIPARLKQLRAHLKEAGLQGMLITRPENRRYLSGFTAADSQIDESSGCLLITRNKQYLLTDSRYDIQARKEAAHFETRIYRTAQVREVAELARKCRIERLAFEEDLVTVRFHRLLKEEVPDIELAPAGDWVSRMREVKDETEIRLITKALHISEKAFQQTLAWLKPGLTEIEVARYLNEAMLCLGSEGPAFETIVASGPNAALPHAVPGRRKIGNGDSIIFDWGARCQGYGADISRTIVPGEPKPWLKRIYQVVRQAQLRAISVLGPGVQTDHVDQAGREVIEQAGFGPYFGHSLGHGVGLATHEAPSLSPFRPSTLQAGMIVTVEPGIYLEKRGGVRLEQLALITADGARLLNRDRTFYDWSA